MLSSVLGVAETWLVSKKGIQTRRAMAWVSQQQSNSRGIATTPLSLQTLHSQVRHDARNHEEPIILISPLVGL